MRKEGREEKKKKIESERSETANKWLYGNPEIQLNCS